MTSIEEARIVSVKNLHFIFAEGDKEKRNSAIAELWANSDDSVVVNAMGAFHGLAQISKCVDQLQEKTSGWVFTVGGR